MSKKRKTTETPSKEKEDEKSTKIPKSAKSYWMCIWYPEIDETYTTEQVEKVHVLEEELPADAKKIQRALLFQSEEDATKHAIKRLRLWFATELDLTDYAPAKEALEKADAAKTIDEEFDVLNGTELDTGDDVVQGPTVVIREAIVCDASV